MSALLTQLQAILKSWDNILPLPNEEDASKDSFPVQSPAIPTPGTSKEDFVSHQVHAHESIVNGEHIHLLPVSLLPNPQDSALLKKANDAFSPFQDTRQTLSRLELARAALALFVSNAGPYRLILTKLLKFVFEYIDFLIDKNPFCFGRELGPTDDESTCGVGAVSTAGDGGLEISKAEDLVARTNQKIHLVESRMAALVEESTAQRYRFKAQLLAQQQTQAKLEQLLQKQVEINHMLTSFPVGKHGDESGMAEQAPSADGSSSKRATYAQQLIARAEKEFTIMELDAQVAQLTVERDTLQEKLRSLKKLNTKYARQAIELSARVNILKNHNLALTSDALLYQEDATREKQKSQRIQRSLVVSRNVILVLLEIRRQEMVFGSSGYGNNVGGGEMKGGGEAPEASGNGTHDRREGSSAFSEYSVDKDYHPKPDRSSTPDVVSLSTTMPSTADAPVYSTEDFLLSIQDGVLRKQLQDIISINDASNGGAAKGALLKLLNLQWSSLTGKKKNSTATKQLLPMLKDVKSHLWVPPYGQNYNVPLHLYSCESVMLIPFHPLVAECFVHELLSQRLDFFEFYAGPAHTLNHNSRGKRWSLADAAVKPRDRDKHSSPIKASAQHKFRFHTRSPMSVPLDEFIVLFINMVWLNKNALVTAEATGQQDDTDASERDLSNLKQEKQECLTNHATSDSLDFFSQYISSHGPQATPEQYIAQPRSQLTIEGLKLAYGLDVASRRQDCSFLTYAYGLASRRQLSELIFTVMRNDRDVFLALCVSMEREQLSAKARPLPTAQGNFAEPYDRNFSPNNRFAGLSNGARLESGKASDTESCAEGRGKLLGCIPTVQLARVLMCMFPSYPIARIEQMVLAAIEDGADSAQAPHMLYYTVLLPERLLPGSMASGTAVELSVSWNEGRFAALFYKSICDDALESMQLLEDTLHIFGDNLAVQKRRVGLLDAVFTSPHFRGIDFFASPEQLMTFGMKTLPVAERRRWGRALNVVLERCPLLKTVLSTSRPNVALDEGTRGGGGESAASGTAQPADTEQKEPWKSSLSLGAKSITSLSAFTAEAGYVKLSEVMLYLRQHVLLRRGLYPSYVETSQSLEDSGQGTVSEEEKAAVPGWTDAQLEYLNTLQSTWEHYVTEHKSILPTDAQFFFKLLMETDSQRFRVWASADVAYESPLLRHKRAFLF